MTNDERANVSSDLKPPALTKSRRRRWKSILLGLIILLCGFALGAGTAVVVVHKFVVQAIHHPEKTPERIVNRMKRRLDISDEQAVKVKAILTEHQNALLAILRKAMPQIKTELQQTRDEVAAVLNPQQAEKWRKRFDHLRSKWFHHMERKPEK